MVKAFTKKCESVINLLFPLKERKLKGKRTPKIKRKLMGKIKSKLSKTAMKKKMLEKDVKNKGYIFIVHTR